MTYQVTIQYAADNHIVPRDSLLCSWASAVLTHQQRQAEVTIRIVDIDEMTKLNENYRHKQGPTNVLSFPADLPEEVEEDYLGDIVICAPVVNREAKEQGKTEDLHWAHMVVHGMFHLLGHDHETETEAEAMETLEIAVLQNLGFSNPYQHGETFKHYES